MRRPSGSGSIIHGPDGVFQIKIYLRDGRRVFWRRRTREDAESALVEMMAKHKHELGYITHLRRTGYPWPGGMAKRPPRSGVTVRTRFMVFERDGFKCVYCGSTDKLVIDHIQPVADGGTDDMENLATACWLCNAGKADRPLLTRPPGLA